MRARLLFLPAAKTLCRILGQRARDQGRLEAALQWYLRAKDMGRIAG